MRSNNEPAITPTGRDQLGIAAMAIDYCLELGLFTSAPGGAVWDLNTHDFQWDFRSEGKHS